MRLGIGLFTSAVATIVGSIVVLSAPDTTGDAADPRQTRRARGEFAVDRGESVGLGVEYGPSREEARVEVVTADPAHAAEDRLLLAGRVADLESGAPVSAIRLSLEIRGRRLAEQTIDAEDGAFSLRGDEDCAAAIRRAGSFELVAESLDPDEDRPHLGTRTRLDAARIDREERVVVGVVRARALEGRVLDASGLPVRFAYLEAAPPSCEAWLSLAADWKRRTGLGTDEGVDLCAGERSTARTGPDGRFRIGSLAPVGVADCVVLPSPTSPDCPRLAFDVTAAAREERRDLDLVLPDPATSIEGRVHVAGAPARGTVSWRDGRVRGEISTDGEGRFRIVGIDPGTIEVRARIRTGETSEIRSVDLVRGERRDLDLAIVAADS